MGQLESNQEIAQVELKLSLWSLFSKLVRADRKYLKDVADVNGAGVALPLDVADIAENADGSGTALVIEKGSPMYLHHVVKCKRAAKYKHLGERYKWQGAWTNIDSFRLYSIATAHKYS